MTAEISHILPTGDVEVDGDVRTRYDFLQEDDSEPNPEEVYATEILGVIEAWEAANRFKQLARRGAKDIDVRRVGGIGACLDKSKQLQNEARRNFLRAHEYPVDEPHGDYEDEVDSYYAGLQAWARFKKDLSSPAVRAQMKRTFEQRFPASQKQE